MTTNEGQEKEQVQETPLTEETKKRYEKIFQTKISGKNPRFTEEFVSWQIYHALNFGIGAAGYNKDGKLEMSFIPPEHYKALDES